MRLVGLERVHDRVESVVVGDGAYVLALALFRVERQKREDFGRRVEALILTQTPIRHIHRIERDAEDEAADQELGEAEPIEHVDQRLGRDRRHVVVLVDQAVDAAVDEVPTPQLAPRGLQLVRVEQLHHQRSAAAREHHVEGGSRGGAEKREDVHTHDSQRVFLVCAGVGRGGLGLALLAVENGGGRLVEGVDEVRQDGGQSHEEKRGIRGGVEVHDLLENLRVSADVRDDLEAVHADGVVGFVFDARAHQRVETVVVDEKRASERVRGDGLQNGLQCAQHHRLGLLVLVETRFGDDLDVHNDLRLHLELVVHALVVAHRTPLLKRRGGDARVGWSGGRRRGGLRKRRIGEPNAGFVDHLVNVELLHFLHQRRGAGGGGARVER